ncbi:MAG: STAS domain-containing protein, partial [Proteobacteria bacterium]|nr:STAS domain-containing protein [Pseudomonadota bacterium]
DIGKTTQTIQSIATTLHDLTDHPDVLEDLLVQVTGGTIRADCDDVTLVMLSASAGLSEFRESSGTFDVAEAVEEEQPEIAYLDTIETTFLTLTGRITWLYGQILFDTANGAIEADHNLVTDLAHCDYMDSTILGTLHELSVNAVSQKRHIQIQNVSPALRASFEELSMTVVMKHIASVPEQVPEGLTPLDLSMSQLERQQQRLLKAHEALSALSQENQAQFESLLETLRSEMDES